MRKTMLALLATIPLAACAGGYGGPYGPGPVAYDGYYDDYYGPIYDGYWGRGDLFYYRPSEHGRFVADRGHHFRHDVGPAPDSHFHAMHGSFNPPAGHHGR